jgi:hypothetical protein
MERQSAVPRFARRGALRVSRSPVLHAPVHGGAPERGRIAIRPYVRPLPSIFRCFFILNIGHGARLVATIRVFGRCRVG